MPAMVGTDTGVGKTEAAVAFQRFLEPRYGMVPIVKPYVSGEENGRWADLERLGVAPEDWPPARYCRPLSPYGAVRRGEPLVELAATRRYLATIASRHERFIVEGIGGVAVPLAPGRLWLDLHADEGWPAVVIARGGLGTINHSLLTIEALRRRTITVVGAIFRLGADDARSDAAENAAIIGEFAGVEALGIVDYDDVDPVAAWGRGVDWIGLERLLG